MRSSAEQRRLTSLPRWGTVGFPPRCSEVCPRDRLPCLNNVPILLANPLQSSKRTFSWGHFLSFFAFQEGMWDTQVSALLSSPTVSVPFLRHWPALPTQHVRTALWSLGY